MSDRRLSSAVFDPIRVLAVIAAALLIAGVAFEVGHATRKKDKVASSSSPTTVKPGVLGSTVTSPDETTTTAAAAATTTTAATTETTVAAGTQGATTATTAAPAATTTTTRPPARSCGNGTASARATLTVNPAGADSWNESGSADVSNGTDRTIVVDKLTVRLTFTDGSFETFTPDGAIGAQLAPSQIRGFAYNRTTAKQGKTVDIVEFQMHPAGTGSECASQPA